MSEDNKNEEEPKIIIDEDWKSQVEREKEEAKAQSASAADGPAEPQPSDTTEPAEPVASEPQADSAEEMPPATLTMLVTNLATQAMGAMGHLPGDDGQPLPKNLPIAKHFIDLLGMLEEKTKGNLDQQEERYLGDALHQLRMLFVQAGK